MQPKVLLGNYIWYKQYLEDIQMILGSVVFLEITCLDDLNWPSLAETSGLQIFRKETWLPKATQTHWILDINKTFNLVNKNFLKE